LFTNSQHIRTNEPLEFFKKKIQGNFTTTKSLFPLLPQEIMETLTATALRIPFVPTTESYALPDPRIITSLISPSVNKHLVKNQNLFPIDTQRFQPLSIKSYVDAITAAVGNTSDDNELIPTPPLSAGATESPTSAKRFLETDGEVAEQAVMVETPTIEKAGYNSVVDNFSKASPLHLHCLPIPDDILVSLLERQVEIRDLVKANEEFFAMVKATIHSDTQWEKFEKILYMERKELSDKEWMFQLSEFLTVNPALLMKFKDIVGYWGDIPSDANEETVSHDDYYVDTLLIRDHPERLASFEKLYPDFFANAYKDFDKNRELYAEFKRILFATRYEMSDEEWDDRLYGVLSRFPSLLGQFEDIIAFELGQFEDIIAFELETDDM